MMMLSAYYIFPNGVHITLKLGVGSFEKSVTKIISLGEGLYQIQEMIIKFFF